MQQQISYTSLIKLHAWHFKKRISNWLTVIVFLLAGYYGLFQGLRSKEKQVATIDAFRHERDSTYTNFKNGLVADTTTKVGKEAYNSATSLFALNYAINLPVYKPPTSTAIFNIGQSDVYPYYYNIRLESFVMQLFKQTEIGNPLRSLTGHFDVTFWLIYLLPLLALLLCFDALAAEKDNGNWPIIFVQGITAKKWLATKFLLAAIIIGSLLFIIALSGLVVNFLFFKEVPTINDLLFFVGAIVYLFFWMATFYLINASGKNTGHNALVGGLLWVCICVLLPSSVSRFIENIVPVDNTQVSAFSRRPQNTMIDSSNAFAASLITAFAVQEPAYKLADTISSKPAFQSRVYRSWHTTLDNKRWPLVEKYYRSIERRQSITDFSTIINPASSIDGLLTGLAANDAPAQFDFVSQAKGFYGHVQNIFYPPLFFRDRLVKTDYDKVPVFRYKAVPLPVGLAANYLLLVLLSTIILVISNKRLKKYQ